MKRMTKNDINFFLRNPVHSDFIIHWTGNDIDDKCRKNWISDHELKKIDNSSHLLKGTKRNITDNKILSNTIVKPYIERLKFILRFGLWTTEIKNKKIKIGANEYELPEVHRTCFTELKLSEVRAHAAQYGGLGIGFKRPFINELHGMPVYYYYGNKKSEFNNPIFKAMIDELKYKNESKLNSYWLHYLKPMSESGCDYTFYDESEWRIIYSADNIFKDVMIKIKSYEEYCNDNKYNKYFNFIKRKLNYDENKKPMPKYFIPIKSKWLAIIIYPSLAVKVAAEADKEIRDLIKSVKEDIPKKKKLKGLPSASYEKFLQPIEIDINTCAHF